jgi:hypothetical protein
MSTIPDVNIPHPLALNGATQFFSVSQYTFDVIVVLCCMNATISTLSSSRKQLPSASCQADNVRLNFFGLSGECV